MKIHPQIKYLSLIGVCFVLVFGILIKRNAAENEGTLMIRQPVLAGSWYPENPSELAGNVTALYEAAAQHNTPEVAGEPIALIVPHAGYRFSGKTAAVGYQVLRGRNIKRILLLAFPHRYALDRLAFPSFEAWRSPLGDIRVDLEVRKKLLKSDLVIEMPEIDRVEHSAEIQIPLLQAVISDEVRLIPLYVGDLSASNLERAADLLLSLWDHETMVVVSSDFTHYGPNYSYRPFAFNQETPSRLQNLDMGAVTKIQTLDPEPFTAYLKQTGDTICGRNPIRLLLAMLNTKKDKEAILPTLLSYETSGEIIGDYENSVSYVAMLFSRIPNEMTDAPLTEEDHAILLDLARKSVTESVKTGHPAILDGRLRNKVNIPARLHKVQGAFVTLWKKNDELRGCIGNITGRMPLFLTVIEMAQAAALKDQRFSPVKEAELSQLKIEVSVLSPLTPVKELNEINVGTHGVLLQKGMNQGVFLPEVATRFGWDREELLRQLCRKAELPLDAYKSKDAKLFRFTSDSFHEKKDE